MLVLNVAGAGVGGAVIDGRFQVANVGRRAGNRA